MRQVPNSPQQYGSQVPAALSGSMTDDVEETRPNIWLRLTSWGWNHRLVTVEEREQARRSRLASWLILGLLVFEILLLPAGKEITTTFIAVVVAIIGTLFVAFFVNRAGYVNAAGIILAILFSGALMGAVVGSPGGYLDTVYLPAYDLFVIPVGLVAAIVRPRYAIFLTTLGCIMLIVGDFYAQPIRGDLAHWMIIEGAVPLLARPIALLTFMGILSYLVARSTDDAIRRADRAEEIARLESVVVEQKRALDQGVYELTQAFVRAANGDYSSRVNIPRQNPLWSLGAQMNTFVQRLQQAGQSTFELERTRQEAFRLASALDDWRAGRMPLWPAPSGTMLDPIIQRLSGGRQ